MSLDRELQKRSSVCELCAASEGLKPYEVAPSNGTVDQHILVCSTCQEQIEDKEKMDANHWRCLNDSMWSTVPAVQVMAWRMLNRLKAEGWPQDLLDMLYLDEETMTWAQATGEGEDDEDKVKHVDSNGVELQPGDSVVLIKDLKVSGAGFTAKRGTAVRRISLVADDPTHIEGRVEGQQIYILTKWIKKI
ncbi:PhnA domain-containing protein [Marinifilum caeruleilacunae]|uniref:PhnA protein n=1 Tax=Marinifilum caeruleilacunae TaxID=2499076 RepID=A0ABX1WW27_9BACT|nr:alkylphosphonate utilization protein [Marinifilum caeruleilacunae]NOU60311.1 PhnA protein [Marinifilum caeruleilacunae]